ncbi:MAG: signal peptide peptidase SppA [Elusimicrobiota bacterium]
MTEKKSIVGLFLIFYIISLAIGGWLILASPGKKGDKSLNKLKGKIPSFSEARETVAWVEIYGPIQVGMGGRSIFGYGSDHIVRKLHSIRENKSVKAVVLRINSPGGSVAAVQEIYKEVMELRKEKKVVVASMGDVAASGGYYIASAADKIVANPGTITGSIGVIMEFGNLAELFRKIGVNIEVIKSGKYKDISSFSRSITEEEKLILQGLINDAYEQFVQSIVQGRKMDETKVRNLADGRIFTGSQALREGLVDSLGNFEEAIALAAQLANIKGKPEVSEDFEPWKKLRFLFNPGYQDSSISKILPAQKVRFEYTME